MNRTALSKEIAKKKGVSQKEALKYIDLITESIVTAMEKGERVEIRGFGSFLVKKYEKRIGINPKSGEKITIQAKKLPSFKPGKDLKNKINHK
jgi:integration host factor subunit beta